MTRYEHDWTKVYRKGAKRAHIMQLLSSAHPYAPSSWDDDSWLGTGSQEEYEAAAALPLCMRCSIIQAMYEQPEGEDP